MIKINLHSNLLKSLVPDLISFNQGERHFHQESKTLKNQMGIQTMMLGTLMIQLN